MVLLQITSYRQAVDTEVELRRAIALLRARYGRQWRRRAPADVVWMPRTGIQVDAACATGRGHRPDRWVGLGGAACLVGAGG